MEKKAVGWSNSTLKIIAVVTMFLDHIGAILLEPYIIKYPTSEWIFVIDSILRFIGRIAFPIFIFLLLEGFEHTRSRKKYGLQLFIFALISEIPFDLALSGQWSSFEYQNVLFTLLLGYLSIWCYEFYSKKQTFAENIQNKNVAIRIFCKKWIGIGSCILLGFLGQTDYGAFGVCAIFLLYKIKKEKRSLIFWGTILFLWEVTAPIAFVLTGQYNGRRGMQLKYIFYWFYPLHLLFLGCIRIFLLNC